MLRFWRIVALISGIGVAIFTGGLFLLPMVSEHITEPPATPSILGPLLGDGPVASVEDWRDRRTPLLREAFQHNVYGRLPPSANVTVEKRAFEMRQHSAYAEMEEWTLRFAVGAQPGQVRAIAVFPQGLGPFPVIVMEQFCSNRAAFKNDPEITAASPLVERPCEGDWMRPIIRTIFGTYIFSPPIQRAVERGYAVVMLQAGEIVPDDQAAALQAFDAIAPTLVGALDRPGAIGVWAWTFSRVLDAIEQDARFDRTREALWGHSRYGKAALVAAAYDDRPDAVIALQSGTGGAKLSRSLQGESIKAITGAYPHWFSPAFAAYAGREAELPIDQHQLIGLIAPRPILIGGARQDGWSDPQGAFRAAEGAGPVYALFGAKGLGQQRMNAFNPDADIAFFVRPGLHGVTTRDWDKTLTFLDAHFRGAQLKTPQPQALQPRPVRL